MAQDWTPVGSAGDIPEGEMRSFQVGGEDIGVANVGGTLYGFSDVCTHRQCALVADGDLDDRTVTCACHGSEFDVTTGAVLNGPATEPLETYEVSEEDGQIRIGI